MKLHRFSIYGDLMSSVDLRKRSERVGIVGRQHSSVHTRLDMIENYFVVFIFEYESCEWVAPKQIVL